MATKLKKGMRVHDPDGTIGMNGSKGYGTVVSIRPKFNIYGMTYASHNTGCIVQWDDETQGFNDVHKVQHSEWIPITIALSMVEATNE